MESRGFVESWESRESAESRESRKSHRIATLAALAILAIAIFCAGCGYYPISYYSKQSLGSSLFVESRVNLADPENSVIAKDALNQAIAQKFHANLVPRAQAESVIVTEITDVDVYSIADNDAGFANFYRASVRMSFSYTDKKGNARKFSNYGFYDFPVDVISTITDETRFNAIKEASLSAIDKFVAQVAYYWNR